MFLLRPGVENLDPYSGATEAFRRVGMAQGLRIRDGGKSENVKHLEAHSLLKPLSSTWLPLRCCPMGMQFINLLVEKKGIS